MPASGKNKENSLNCKLKKAVSRSNSSKKKHLLLKPNSSHCKHSVSKFANSSSTLHSNNISKVSSHQKNSVKPREIVSQSLIKEITAADKKLNETLYILECSVDNSEAKWFEAVEGIGRQLNHPSVKSLISTIQSGYQSFLIAKKPAITKKKSKLSLDISKAKRDSPMQYHEQFLSKVNEFSPSWRECLRMEKKSSA